MKSNGRDGGVHIVEVLPREGLQQVLKHAELHALSTAEKLALIEELLKAGLREIEVTNFAHPKVIPGLADAEQVVRQLGRRRDIIFRAVVPNEKGMERAIAVDCQKVVVLMNCSETYSQLNSRMSMKANVSQVEQIWEMGQRSGVAVSIGMAICFVCPYEGMIPEERIAELFTHFADMGCHEITISDSLGMATPDHMHRLCAKLVELRPAVDLGLHLHDLVGLALANILAAYGAGVRTYETALCGFGGGIAMPIDVRMMGNVPTEDVIYMFERMGINTGVDIARLVHAGRLAENLFGQISTSRILGTRVLEEQMPIGTLIHEM